MDCFYHDYWPVCCPLLASCCCRLTHSLLFRCIKMADVVIVNCQSICRQVYDLTHALFTSPERDNYNYCQCSCSEFNKWKLAETVQAWKTTNSSFTKNKTKQNYYHSKSETSWEEKLGRSDYYHNRTEQNRTEQNNGCSVEQKIQHEKTIYFILFFFSIANPLFSCIIYDNNVPTSLL